VTDDQQHTGGTSEEPGGSWGRLGGLAGRLRRSRPAEEQASPASEADPADASTEAPVEPGTMPLAEPEPEPESEPGIEPDAADPPSTEVPEAPPGIPSTASPPLPPFPPPSNASDEEAEAHGERPALEAPPEPIRPQGSVTELPPSPPDPGASLTAEVPPSASAPPPEAAAEFEDEPRPEATTAAAEAAPAPTDPTPLPPALPTPAVPRAPVAMPGLIPSLDVATASLTEDGDVILEPEDALSIRRSTPISAFLVVLTAVATGVILAFLLIEPSPRWLLVIGTGAVVLGLDGTLKQTWREPFALGQETAPFLFVPALYMLAVPVLIEHNITGEWVLLAGLGAGLGLGTLAWAETASVRAFGAEYPQARIIVTANTYLVGFAIFSMTYVFDIPLAMALVATGVAAAMLAVEVLREGEIDPMETLGYALVTGVLVAEARWLFYYMPLDTYLAGLTLVLVFYLVTGLLHSHIVRALTRPVAAEYGAITAAGLALVALARASGLA
jgi:hypothetical protein